MITRLVAILIALLSGTLTLSPVAAAAPAQAVDSSLGFKAAFPRHFYEKKYFGIAVAGASIASAAVFSYATAGAGAPAAAAGVSTVASWVAGGGAGSYMAGLSTIGGWFGGNAMLGAAILNGISLGTVGGATSFAMMSAGQKALAMGSIAATTLDGVAILGKHDTQQIRFSLTLPVPRALADKRLGRLIDSQEKVNKRIAKLSDDSKKEASRSVNDGKSEPAAPSTKAMTLEQNLKAERARREAIDKQIEGEIDRALNHGAANGDRLVLAVLAHNLGKQDRSGALLDRIEVTSDYLTYLRAVNALLQEDHATARQLLEASSKQAPYAIEPQVLLVSVLGAKTFAENEDAILDIAKEADASFDADAYASPLSLVSLHYRIGTLARQAGRCNTALEEFDKAHNQLSLIQKYVAGKDIRSLLDVGRANALYCQGKKEEAEQLFAQARNSAKDESAKKLLCTQYSGGCN